MSLTPFVQVLARGPGRSRSLTQQEAGDAMRIMLSGQADREAVGALLMLLRMKGETAEEIAGLAGAAREAIGQMPRSDLDWPSYAAGRSRGQPWFLLSAKLVARAGFRVLLHGWNGPDSAVRDGLARADITTAHSPQDASDALDRHGIVYLPLEHLSPALFDLLRLRDVLGLRSCMNTVSRMLNPGAAGAGVQGVFHPSYRLLQADAAQLMGWSALTVIKGGGGEFERHPGKPAKAFGLRAQASWQESFPAENDATCRLAEGPEGFGTLNDLWNGRYRDPFATAIVLGTATLAFDTLGVSDPRRCAENLWADRLTPLAA
ncbi:MAG: glycosyl transferase family protein [Arenibacterium sp.]